MLLQLSHGESWLLIFSWCTKARYYYQSSLRSGTTRLIWIIWIIQRVGLCFLKCDISLFYFIFFLFFLLLLYRSSDVTNRGLYLRFISSRENFFRDNFFNENFFREIHTHTHTTDNMILNCTCMPRRYVVSLFTFFGLFLVYAMRLNLSVAVVSMTTEQPVKLANGTTTRVSR